MASLNGNAHRYHASRRRLIQPVLPALPLSSGPSKAIQKPNGEINGIVNGAESLSTVRVENQTNLACEKTSTGQIKENSGSPTPLVDETRQQDNTTVPPIVAEDIQEVDRFSASDVSKPADHPENVKPGRMYTEEGAANHSNGFAGSMVFPRQEAVSEEKRDLPYSSNGDWDALNGEQHKDELDTALKTNARLTEEIQAAPSLSIDATDVAADNPDDLGISRHDQPLLILDGSDTSVHPSKTSKGGIFSPIQPPVLPTIHSHLANIEHTQHWCDCELHVFPPNANSPSIHRNAHSLVLLRSERLRQMLYAQRSQSYFYHVVNLFPARIIDPSAFEAALRFFYTDTIVSADHFMHTSASTGNAGRVEALNYVFSYMVSGLELGIEVIVRRAFEMLANLIDWDIAELCVKEAQNMRVAVTKIPQSPLELIITAQSIFQNVFNLFILRLDTKKFALDKTSTPVKLIPRFSQLDPGKSTFNPVLANMVFGSMPVSAGASPISVDETSSNSQHSPNTIASMIMLNLDFEDFVVFARILMKACGEEGRRIIDEVVEERERCRLNILENRAISNKQRSANQSMWDVVGWHEFVENDTLKREYEGFLLPGKDN